MERRGLGYLNIQLRAFDNKQENKLLQDRSRWLTINFCFRLGPSSVVFFKYFFFLVGETDILALEVIKEPFCSGVLLFKSLGTCHKVTRNSLEIRFF